MSFWDNVGGLLGAGAGGALGGPAGAGAGAGIGSWVQGLLGGGGGNGEAFMKDMELSNNTGAPWFDDYAKWVQKYQPDVWSGRTSVWDDDKHGAFSNAWAKYGGLELDANLVPVHGGANDNTKTGPKGKPKGNGDGGGGLGGGPIIWYWPWDKDAFKLAGGWVMAAWGAMLVALGGLVYWAVKSSKPKRRRRTRRSM